MPSRPRTAEQKAARREYERKRKQNDPAYRDKLREYGRKFRATHPGAWTRYAGPTAASRMRAHLKHRYGITVDEYEGLFKAQGGKCAICGLSPSYRLYVDHDHKTGRIRGLLCSACNTGLGHLGDSGEALRRALAYIESR